MRHVGVREFKTHATSMLSCGETFVIERHGEPIGFFVPIRAKDRKGGHAALARLDKAVLEVLEQTGLGEDDLVEEVWGVTRGKR